MTGLKGIQVMGRKEVDKSVLSTPDLRVNFFKLLTILEQTEMALPYHHHGKVYLLKAYATGKNYKQIRTSKHKLNPLTITQAKCEQCGGLSINRVCFTDSCPRSKLPASTTAGIL